MKKSLAIILILILISINSNFYFVDDNELDIEKAAIKVIEQSTAVRSANRSEANATSQYSTAHNFSRGYNIVAANNSEYQLKVSQRNSAIAEAEVKLSAYSQYINILKANYALQLQQAITENSETNYKNIQIKFKSKQVSSEDLNSSAQALKKEKLAFQIKKRSLDSLVMSLNAAMCENIKNVYTDFIDSNLVPSPEIGELAEYINNGLNNRAEILNAQELLPIKILEKDYNQSSHPLSTDIFYIQSSYDIETAKNNIEDCKINVQLDITNYYKELESKMKAMESTQKQFELQSTNYNTMKIKFSLKQISNSELADENVSYLKAKIDFKCAQLDAWFSQTKMSYVSGIGPGI